MSRQNKNQLRPLSTRVDRGVMVYPLKFLLLFQAIFALSCSIARADDYGKEKDPPSMSSGKERLERGHGTGSEHETAALGFIALNHPELVEVLNRLRVTHRAEYEKALRQIYQTSERLTHLNKDDPERHDAELRLWKIDSRLQLLAARLSVENTSLANDELKQVVREELEAKTALLALERNRHQAQLKQLDLEMARLKDSRDKEIDARVNELKKEISRMKHKSSKGTLPQIDPKSKSSSN